MKLNRKNKLLILGLILSFYLCYSLAIGKTIEYYNEYKDQRELISTTNNNPKLLFNLLLKEKQIDQWLSLNDYVNTGFQSELLKELNDYCSMHNLKIVDFKEPHQIIEKKTEINNYSFSVEGSFNTALGLVNKIENNPRLGFIKHLSTEKKMNYKSNEEYILTTLILQKKQNIK